MVEDWVNYICPVDGAAEVLKSGDPSIGLQGDPSVAKNPLIFPPKATLDKAHVFKSLSADEETKFNQLFADLTGTHRRMQRVARLLKRGAGLSPAPAGDGLACHVLLRAHVLPARTSRTRTGNLLEGFNQVYRNFRNYTDAIRRARISSIRSIGYAGAATVLAFLISYPLAYVIAFRGGRYKNLLLMLVIAPFFTNYLIRTLAWETILADHGVVASTLKSLHVLSVTDALGFTGSAAAGNAAGGRPGITYNYLPFMVLPLYVSLEKIDKRLLEAARRPLRQPRQGVHEGHLAAVAAGHLRRHAADVHPGHR